MNTLGAIALVGVVVIGIIIAVISALRAAINELRKSLAAGRERRQARRAARNRELQERDRKKDEAARLAEEQQLEAFRQNHPAAIVGAPDIKALQTIDDLLDRYISAVNGYRPTFVMPATDFRSIKFSYPFDFFFPRCNGDENGPEPSPWKISIDAMLVTKGRPLASIYRGLDEAFVFSGRMPEVGFDRTNVPRPLPVEIAELKVQKPDIQVVSASDGAPIDLSTSFLQKAYKPFLVKAANVESSLIELQARIQRKIEEALEAKELFDIRLANEELKSREAARAIKADFEACRNRFEQEADRALAPIRAVHQAFLAGTPEGTEAHFNLALRTLALPLPEGYPWQVFYKVDERLIQVNQRVPPLSDLTVKRTDSKRAPAKRDVEQFLRRYVPAISLQIAAHVALNDSDDRLNAIAVNCWTRFFEKSTGRLKNAFVSSLSVTKSEILGIDIVRADPLEAFRALKGAFVYSTDEIVAIEPSIRLDKSDARFVQGRDVLEGMAQGQNLATMDWQDFEHLIRELLAKEYGTNGTDVRITRASRDRGVDAVIFDPDPLRGGKYVVQAKRYNNLVDVSAVRDLYGTMMNEGAARGILVTTSHYGRDAHEFASNKPITLLDGQHLLSMLSKHGYQFKIQLG